MDTGIEENKAEYLLKPLVNLLKIFSIQFDHYDN